MEKPIELIDFVKGKKIPSQLLEQRSYKPKSISAFRILMAYALDTFMIATSTFAIASIFKLSLATFIISDQLLDHFHDIDFNTMAFQLFPLMSLSYFFFSFFFNQGQTWGMHHLKVRLKMEHFNFQSSLSWAMYSCLVIMSIGLAYPLAYSMMKKKTQNTFEGHDHLYLSLMAERQLSPINLISKTEEKEIFATQREYVEEHLDKAA